MLPKLFVLPKRIILKALQVNHYLYETPKLTNYENLKATIFTKQWYRCGLCSYFKPSANECTGSWFASKEEFIRIPGMDHQGEAD
jgi:hypothetical protein